MGRPSWILLFWSADRTSTGTLVTNHTRTLFNWGDHSNATRSQKTPYNGHLNSANGYLCLVPNANMSINGQTIQNEAISFFVDLEGATHAPGAHIILYHLNKTGGTRNQNVCCFGWMIFSSAYWIIQWRFIPVNAGKNLFTIQSVLTGGYASVDSPAAVSDSVCMDFKFFNLFSQDQAVKHCLTSTPWEVVVVGYSSADFMYVLILFCKCKDLRCCIIKVSGFRIPVLFGLSLENSSNLNPSFALLPNHVSCRLTYR